MLKKHTRTLRLSDRRMVEYAEYGDPKGKPVFFFHGCFGSCHQGALADVSAKREGVRLIAPNRPGIGRSSPADFRSMIEYADDIAEIADKLGIDTFAILGASAGGCFALACEYALPDRVRNIGAAGCMGPMSSMQNLQDMRLLRRWFLSLCNGFPRISGRLLRLMCAACKKYPEFLFGLLMKTSTALDSQLYKQKGIDDVLREDFEDVFLSEHGVEGMLLEIRMYFHWGFDLRDFPVRKRAFFWHGEGDGIVTRPVIRRISRCIRGSEVTMYQGGHLTFVMGEMKQIISKMKREWDSDVFHDRGPIEESGVHRGRPLIGDLLTDALPRLIRS